MRKCLAGFIASGTLAVGLFVGAGSASALTRTYTCTKKNATSGKTATVKVNSDRAEDYLEAHGFTCVGD